MLTLSGQFICWQKDHANSNILECELFIIFISKTCNDFLCIIAHTSCISLTETYLDTPSGKKSFGAVVSNFQESGDRSKNFFLFAQKDPFGKLFSKIIFKSSSKFLFLQKLGKFKIGLSVSDGLIEIVQISTLHFYLDLNIRTFEVAHVKNTTFAIP